MFYILCIRYILNLWNHKIKFVKIIAGCGWGSVITLVASSLGLLCQHSRFTSEIYGHLSFNTVL